MFHAVYRGEFGDTIEVADPKLAAYKQMAYIRNVLGLRYRLVCQVDGVYTVVGSGLAPLTFAPLSPVVVR